MALMVYLDENKTQHIFERTHLVILYCRIFNTSQFLFVACASGFLRTPKMRRYLYIGGVEDNPAPFVTQEVNLSLYAKAYMCDVLPSEKYE